MEIQDARRSIYDLWLETFGEPPVVDAEPGVMLHILVKCLPRPEPWPTVPSAYPVRAYAALAESILDSLPSMADQSSA